MREKPKQIAGLLAVVLFTYVIGSCKLEPSVESPSQRLAKAIQGMPAGLKIYEPQTTTDGTTTTLTYTVSADFSNWAGSPLAYTALESGDPEAQSVEALIKKYGQKGDDTWLFSSPVSAVEPGSYSLNTAIDNKGTPFALIQLDTDRIKAILQNKRPPKESTDADGDPVYEKIVWVEENEGGIANIEKAAEVWGLNVSDEPVNTFVNLNGVRVLGLHVVTNEDNIKTLEASGTIENFDDGKAVDEEEPLPVRDQSISTVLAGGTTKKGERYTATINFYTGTEVTQGESSAEAIVKKLTPPPTKDGDIVKYSPSLTTAESMKNWIKNNPPVLRVVYRWADDVQVSGGSK